MVDKEQIQKVVERMFKRYKRNDKLNDQQIRAALNALTRMKIDWVKDRDFIICSITVMGDGERYLGASKRNKEDVPRDEVGQILSFKRAIIDLDREYNFFRRPPT